MVEAPTPTLREQIEAEVRMTHHSFPKEIGDPCVICEASTARVTALEEENGRLIDDLDRWVHKVEMPHAAHLHYEGCPFKPFADTIETPEDAPDCTCAERHKAAYWKGQLVLERGEHAVTRGRLTAQAAPRSI